MSKKHNSIDKTNIDEIKKAFDDLNVCYENNENANALQYDFREFSVLKDVPMTMSDSCLPL